jgi:hypothetical protein
MSAIADRPRFGAYKIFLNFSTFDENLNVNSVKISGRSRHRIDAKVAFGKDRAEGVEAK